MSDHALNDSLDADKQALLDLLLAEQGFAEARKPRSRIERTGADRGPLSSAQLRLWLLYELAPESTAYNLTSALRAQGRLRPEILAQALDRIVRRHGILRTTFHRDPEGAPFQVVHPTFPVPITVEDLSGLPAAEREAEVQRRAAKESDKP